MKVLSTLTVGLALTAGAALAEYPERPINMIIPYGAGGATDISARTIAEALGEAVGRPLIMANVTGAGGATGSVAAMNANPDGYTMLFTRVGSHSVNPAMKATLPYTLDDFRYVTVYEINPFACAVAANSDIKTMDDLMEKAKGEGVSYSSSGVGSALHLGGAMVLDAFGLEDAANAATHIPQQGGGAAATAVLNGTADFLCTNTSALAGFVANGQMTPLMVTTAEPVVGFDAPTAAELGHPELEQLVGWTGIAGPKDLPDEVAAKWGEWMTQAATDEKFVNQMESLGSIIDVMSPEEAREFINTQYETFRTLVDELGMRIEG
ncbi:tripartite tricarboxylate transporter substrate binding protein [Jannaschia formosa]|uniref:tripartite tricarboxylate transporter substrate binding protein n=1 Tax=Jannaschia formosa TaxID=2259592 RepID=UPI000E1C308D|nr:tripartite tricarboxylate transporter substrate binding protein [Jannaschia formosa]TFL17601.1 tripartite tricarboxylate transporter substrate binding protein [Jannaschia formosa]